MLFREAGEFPWAPSPGDYDRVDDVDAAVSKPQLQQPPSSSSGGWELGEEGSRNSRGLSDTDVKTIEHGQALGRATNHGPLRNGPLANADGEVAGGRDARAQDNEESEASLRAMDVFIAETLDNVRAKHEGNLRRLSEKVCSCCWRVPPTQRAHVIRRRRTRRHQHTCTGNSHPMRHAQMHGAYDTLSKAQQTLHDYSVQRNALRSTPSSLEAQVCCVYAYVCLWRVCVCVCAARRHASYLACVDSAPALLRPSEARQPRDLPALDAGRDRALDLLASRRIAMDLTGVFVSLPRPHPPHSPAAAVPGNGNCRGERAAGGRQHRPLLVLCLSAPAHC